MVLLYHISLKLLLGQSEGVFSLIKNADLVVQFVLTSLVFLSMLSWAVIFLKLREFFRARRQSEIFLKLFREGQRLDDFFEASVKLKFSPMANLFLAAYREFNRLRRKDIKGVKEDSGAENSGNEQGLACIERILKQSTAYELAKMERMLPLLATTGSSAPFIGLFGTVWGIMNSFRGLIGATGSQSISVVAPGISEALIATAVGLAAAIPAVMAYNHFLSQVRLFEVEIEKFATEFFNMIERSFLQRK